MRGATRLVLGIIFLLMGVCFYLLIYQPNPYCGFANLEDNVSYVSVRRGPEYGLEWLSQEKGSITLSTSLPAQLLDANRPITLLLHGFNVKEGEVGPYFSDAVAHISRAGNSPQSFIVFDWNSDKFARLNETKRDTRFECLDFLHRAVVYWQAQDAVNQILSYEIARGAATQTADALVQLIKLVAKPGAGRRVNIVAHSLGVFLILQALRKHPEISASIRSLVLLASAASDDSFEDSDLTRAILQIHKVHVFYSNNDAVLETVLPMVGSYAPKHGLGLRGPRKPSLLPPNVFLHDVTRLLDGPDVHGQYLRKDGVSAISLVSALD
jgi:pimeloyl-ACP methyl ester carboxylesterase